MRKDVCRYVYILGLGNLGKFVAYALGVAPRARGRYFRPTTLIFHRLGRLEQWEAAGRSIRYSARFGDGQPQSEHPPATHFRTEYVHLPATRGAGFKRFDFTAIRRHHPEVAIHPESPIRCLVVATKAHATVPALAPIRHRLNKDSHILFLQNGMGITEEVSRRLFPDPATRPTYLAGVCHAGVYSTAPSDIVHAGPGVLFVGVVEPQSGAVSAGHPLALHLRAASANMLRVRELEPAAIRQAQLKKLVVNSIINPLTVLFNCENGRVFDSDEAKERYRRLLEEAGAIVRALLPPEAAKEDFSDEALDTLVRDVARQTANNISSMLQDIRAGKPTEIKYINGYLVAEARRLGLPHEHHRRLYQWIRRLEAKIRKAGSSWDAESLDELVRQGRPWLGRDPTAATLPSNAAPDSAPTSSSDSI